MTTEAHNVVQAEFFLVKGAGTLDDLGREMKDRVRDGVPLKICIRLYDEDGALTNAVLAGQHAHERGQKNIKSLESLWRGGRATIEAAVERQIQAAKREEDLFASKARVLAITRLREHAKQKKAIAVERARHIFTLANPEELHELIESVSKAHGAWFFVFKPNDLTADKNERVAWLM